MKKSILLSGLIISLLVLVTYVSTSFKTTPQQDYISESFELNDVNQECWGTGDPLATCICYYETYCVYVLPGSLCLGGGPAAFCD